MPVIIGIIIALFLLFLYALLMGWLWVEVVPEVLVIGSLLGTLAGPLVYGYTAFELFPGSGRRRAFRWPFGLLLALVYFDMATLLLGGFKDTGIDSSSLKPLLRGVHFVVTELPPNRWIIQVFAHDLIEYNWWLVLLVSLLVKGFGLVACLLAVRGLTNEFKDGKQPAPRQYFFGQAYKDLNELVAGSFANLGRVLRIGAAGVLPDLSKVDPGAIWLPVAFTWPLLIAAAIAVAISVIFAGLTLVLVLVAHSLALVGIVTLSLAVSVLLWLIERSIIWVRSRWAKCPHAGCHERVPLPIYRCPKCGANHDRLIPGRYGVFLRRCECGEMLPTFSWFGKQKLRALCQRCKQPMLEALFGANVHVPVYGDTSSGKTMFMMANAWQLLEGRLGKTSVRLIDERDSRSYESQWKPDFESGRARGATSNMLPDAFLLSMRRQDGLPVSLYLYDPRGESMVRERELAGHRFLEYFDGLALLVDPLAIPELARKYREEGHQLPATTSPNPPVNVVDGIKNALMSQSGMRLDRRFKRRVAVVITKGDIPFIQKEFGVTVPTSPPGGDWEALGAETSAKLRSWFETHDRGLLLKLEQHFGDLRFFLVSSLGHDVESGGRFEPKRTLHPLCWLLSTRRALTWPRATRIGTRTAEVAIVAALLLLFLAVPFMLLRTVAPLMASAFDGVTGRRSGQGPSRRPTPRPDGEFPAPAQASAPQLPPDLQALRSAAVIRSNVAGDLVLLDNERLGPTPQRLELAPGSYLVEVLKDGCDSSARRITVKEGVEHEVWFRLECEAPEPLQIAEVEKPAPRPPPRTLAPPRPATRFARPVGGVVADHETGLLWTVEDNGTDIKFPRASDHCRKLYLEGESSWRLPSRKELKSLWAPDAGDRYGIGGGIRLTGCCPWTSELAPNSSAWALDFTNFRQVHWQVRPKTDKDGGRALCVTRARWTRAAPDARFARAGKYSDHRP